MNSYATLDDETRFSIGPVPEDEHVCPHINMIAMSLLAGLSITVATFLLQSAIPATSGDAARIIQASGGADLIFYEICLAGGIFGGILNVALFGETGTRMEHARKFLGGVCAAVLFTAIIARYTGGQDDMRVVFALAGTISLLSYGILRKLVPMTIAWTSKRAEDRIRQIDPP